MGFGGARRWIVLALVVVALAWLAWRLGEWQFHRLEERQARNAVIERNQALPPAPVEQVMAVGREPAPGDQWRVVTATGRYVVADTVVVRYRTREGAAGVDVVVPLELPSGASLLVDRGWLPTDNRGATPADVPAPPPGEVTVTGWVRLDAEGESTVVRDRSTRAIDSDRIGQALDRQMLAGFVDLREESPEAAQPLRPAELPDLDDGPHFFYGLQWWFFGALAIFGFCYLVYDEWRGGGRGRSRGGVRGQSERSRPPSTGSITPVTKEAAGESRNAAARPNSSGSP